MVEPLACVLRGIHETGIKAGDTTVVIGCGPIGLKFIRILSGRGVNVIALGKRPNQIRAAERFGARAAFIAPDLTDPARTVRQLTEGGCGADSVIEAVGTPQTWEWALRMVRRGGTVNLFGGCPRGSLVQVDSNALIIRRSRSNPRSIIRRVSSGKRSTPWLGVKFARAIL